MVELRKIFHRRNKTFVNTLARLGSIADTSSRSVHFKVGNRVRKKFPSTCAGDEKGIVMKHYELSGQYRCVVKCESGREAMFFESELILDQSKS